MTHRENAVEVSHVSKRFPSADVPGWVTALEDVCLTVSRGERLVIAGANGAGKSLLMSIIASLETPTSGLIRTSHPVGLVFQDADSQILGETPREDAAFGPGNMKLPKAEIIRRADAALAAVGLLHKAEMPARSLSGGEKRRLAVAGVLAMDVEIIIFDEPYANLDYEGVKQVNTLIVELHGQGKTLIILTHELEKCLGLADQFVVLQAGKVVFDGDPADALSLPLEQWGIRNPLGSYTAKKDLIWR
ncbi:MAG: energy-coupling factor ABC transporter ATP-binding protein [Treponema sp.]|jgi:biotin transport system ATP-binding protein|nr:energy-coupling factor ABC transporter ATP-binding protein [Treponema sp.]